MPKKYYTYKHKKPPYHFDMEAFLQKRRLPTLPLDAVPSA